MVYNVLVNQINNTMYLMLERIICSEIEFVDATHHNTEVEVEVTLIENDSVLNDWRAIKKELEKKLEKQVYNFVYRYKR